MCDDWATLLDQSSHVGPGSNQVFLVSVSALCEQRGC